GPGALAPLRRSAIRRLDGRAGAVDAARLPCVGSAVRGCRARIVATVSRRKSRIAPRTPHDQLGTLAQLLQRAPSGAPRAHRRSGADGIGLRHLEPGSRRDASAVAVDALARIRLGVSILPGGHAAPERAYRAPVVVDLDSAGRCVPPAPRERV